MASLVKSNSCRNHHFRHFSKSSSQPPQCASIRLVAEAVREPNRWSNESREQQEGGLSPERKAELGSIKDLKNAT